jgi:hypothetical protein
MTASAKVYGGNLAGRWRAILACRSFAEFNRATGISRDFACETRNREEIAQAMSKPGTLFVRHYTRAEKDNPWTERERDDQPPKSGWQRLSADRV